MIRWHDQWGNLTNYRLARYIAMSHKLENDLKTQNLACGDRYFIIRLLWIKWAIDEVKVNDNMPHGFKVMLEFNNIDQYEGYCQQSLGL